MSTRSLTLHCDVVVCRPRTARSSSVAGPGQLHDILTAPSRRRRSCGFSPAPWTAGYPLMTCGASTCRWVFSQRSRIESLANYASALLLNVRGWAWPHPCRRDSGGRSPKPAASPGQAHDGATSLRWLQPGICSYMAGILTPAVIETTFGFLTWRQGRGPLRFAQLLHSWM